VWCLSPGQSACLQLSMWAWRPHQLCHHWGLLHRCFLQQGLYSGGPWAGGKGPRGVPTGLGAVYPLGSHLQEKMESMVLCQGCFKYTIGSMLQCSHREAFQPPIMPANHHESDMQELVW
jgi:hypothetical protein